ncbi:AAA family ATPase [Streptomyces sp. NPDC057137]|uniref:helix-turn-helix transcriptional regulator n=1 Tax=Streptomyces sp. NPDC057137 TaxID=3346030 RepID=UPI0036401096
MDSYPYSQGLVGRSREVAQLDRMLTAAHSGHPSIALIDGPPGSGKTALVNHFAASRTSLRVLRAAGVSWESGEPFGVAGQLARECGEEWDGGQAEPDAGPVGVGLRLLELWERAQEQGGLLIVVDDAHWADLDSLRAMRSAVRRMSNQRILIVLSAADDQYSRMTDPVKEFFDNCRRDAVHLGPLSPDEVKALAGRRSGTSLSSPAARHLHRHTRGNPLYLEQLLAELPPDTWQDWQPVLPAPARYSAEVLVRLNRCTATTRALVEACSVLAEKASTADAARLAGIDDPLPAVDEACATGLLSAAVEPGLVLLSFPHPLVRASVVGSLGLTGRRQLHHAAAQVVEDPVRRLMHRVAGASTADPALADELDHYASERATAGEWSSVADLLVRASRLSSARATRQERLLRAVDAMIGAGDIPQAVTFAGELESFPTGTLRAVVLGYLAIMRGRPAEADMFLSQAWQSCDAAQRPDLAARICQRRVLDALGRWHAPDLVMWARRALELVDPTDPSAVESKAIVGLGLAAMGRPAEAVAAYESAAASTIGSAQLQRFQLGRGWLDLALDAPEAARRELESAVPTVYRMGSTRISLWAQGWLARTQHAIGAWSEALETVERAAAHLAEVRIEMVRPLIHWTGAQIHALRGDWDSADRHLEAASVGMHHYEVMLLPACLARAQVAEAQGDYERVLEALAPVVGLPSRDGIDEPGFWPWQDIYANALVMTNQVAEADAFLLPHEKLAASRTHHATMARLGLARGRVAGALGNTDAARTHFEAALTHLARLPLPYDRARVNFAYGQTLRRAGKRREADTVLKNARDGYTALGALTYVERCNRELKAGGLRTAHDTPGGTRLTAQEEAVARLVSQGASNQEAATELFISVKTVQYHLTRIYSKLNLRSRSELAAQFRPTDDGDRPQTGRSGATRPPRP